MNQRLTRREIKRDDFADAMGRSFEYAESHVRTILYALGGVLALLAVAGLVYYFLARRADQANEALAQAMKIHQAPIEATGAKPNDPTAPTFPNEAARDARARELFQKVHDGYGSTDAGGVAGLYLAQYAAREGKGERARELWSDFVDGHGDHMLAGEARLNLIALDRKEGKAQEVVTNLRGMLEQTKPPLPKDVILHELGTTLEQLKRPEEAVKMYQQILDDFPQSPYRQDAEQKVSALDPSRAGAPAGLPAGFSFPG